MKHFFFLCILAPLLLVPGVARAQETPPAPRFYSGPNPGDPESIAAIAAFDERLHQCDIFMRQARAALAKDDVKKAEALFKQALSFFPQNGEACVRLAEIHFHAKQPGAVVADLEPIVNPTPGSSDSVGSAITTRMLYVLAQLDCGNWEPAAACYAKSLRPDQTYYLPGVGPWHTIPNMQFSPDNPDFFGLRAQAHLILGGYPMQFVEMENQPQYMLDHLRQALKYDPKSLDATYLSGFMLAKMNRFPEARTAYEKAMRMASKEARPEIKQALDALKVKEDAKKATDAAKARQ